MATTKKTATKGSKTIAKATANVVSKVESTAISNKVRKVESAEDKAKALKDLDRTVSKITNEVALQMKHKVLSLQNWLQTYKGLAISADAKIAEQFKDSQKWFSFVVETKRNMNHVIVLTEGKDNKTGEKTLIRSIKPVMWVKKTDKISLPDYFGKAKVASYRYDKVDDKEVTIYDGKELEVTRSVKVPVLEVVTNSEGVSYTTQKQVVNSKGVMEKQWEYKDEVFVPFEQLDFDFKEVKDALKKAMIATFGSNSLVAK